MMVGAWSMLVSIVAPTPVAPLEVPQIAQEVAHEAQSVYMATVSAYSCDDRPDNSMSPCGLFRDGSTPHSGLHGIVAACPLEWLGRVVTVEGWGALRCRDTPRTGWYGSQPHIDVFTSFPAAIRWGIQERKATVE
jgi:hypothetical protein